MHTLSKIGITLTILLMWSAGVAQTQEGSRHPSAKEIIERLKPSNEEFEAKGVEPKPAEKVTTRSITTRSISTRGISVEGRKTQPQVDTPPSIDLDVNFEYASAQLTPDARIILDNLGRALTDPALQNSRFLLAGHTDASGGDAYNLSLSKSRAQAVANYLSHYYGVSAIRLKVEGYGRTKLLDPANPLSAINRRVQVANLSEDKP